MGIENRSRIDITHNSMFNAQSHEYDYKDTSALEALAPMFNHSTQERMILMVSHVLQSLILTNAETPRIYSGAENVMGELSTGYKISNNRYLILKIIRSIGSRYIVFLKNLDDNEIDVISLDRYEFVLNHKGYERYSIFDTTCNSNPYKEGDIIEPGTCFYSNNQFDDNGSIQFGVNLNTYYTTESGKTYEDSYVISESASVKLAHMVVEEETVELMMGNQLLNLPGKKYKIPHIGEKLSDGIYSVVRDSGFNNFLNDSHYTMNDSVKSFYENSVVSDIRVETNFSLDEIKEEFCSEVYEFYKAYLDYPKRILSFVDDLKNNMKMDIQDIISNENIASVINTSMGDYGISSDGNREIIPIELKKFKIIFKLTQHVPAMIGSKITNRYGGKGLVGEIRPDHLMPFDSFGRRADVICNAYSPANRMNPAQLFEQMINMAGDLVKEDMIEKYNRGDISGSKKSIYEFYSYIYNTEQMKQISNIIDNNSSFSKLITELLHGGDLYVHIPPITSEGVEYSEVGKGENDFFEKMRLLKERYTPRTKITGRLIPSIIGSIYYMKLEHESRHKASHRGSGMNDSKGFPNSAKKSNDHHSDRGPFNDNAVRNGEQEENGLGSHNPDNILTKYNLMCIKLETDRNKMSPEQIDIIEKDIAILKHELDMNDYRAYDNISDERYLLHPVTEFRQISNLSSEARKNLYNTMINAVTVEDVNSIIKTNVKVELKNNAVEVLNAHLECIGLHLRVEDENKPYIYSPNDSLIKKIHSLINNIQEE